jgi:hypothetical protein
MLIVKPQLITSANLDSSNVAEDDYPAWEAGPYTTGQRVVYLNKIWEALSNTSDQPDVGAAAIPPTWVFVSATNRFKMFDITVGQGTVNTGSIEVVISPPIICNAVVLFNVAASSAQLIVRDNSDYVVYDTTVDLVDFTNITSYFDYFFAEFLGDGQGEVAFLDIPAYSDATFELIIDAGTGEASCGEMIIGRLDSLGVTNFGTSVSIRDYSIKDIDQFGNINVVERPFSKRAEYDVTVETTDVGRVSRYLSNVRTTPVVYIGDPERSETIIFGYYRDFNIVLSSPSISECAITVEGLV